MFKNKCIKGFRMWKSGKKWCVSGAVFIMVLFGPSDILGAADVITHPLEGETSVASDLNTGSSADTVKPNTVTDESASTETDKGSSTEGVGKLRRVSTAAAEAMNLSLDMDASTTTTENDVSFNLTSDGVGWPSSPAESKQFGVAGNFTAGQVITITVPKGIVVSTYDAVAGMTVSKSQSGKNTVLTYRATTDITASINVSYYFGTQGDNAQFAPGSTALPVTVTSDTTTVSGNIIAVNPTTSSATARVHNTAVSNNVFTADGNSIYNFVLGIKTTPDFTDSSQQITQAIHAKMSGVIHVPKGFVLTGASVANYLDTQANAPTDGGAVPPIPSGLTQPGGAGSDIIVSDIVGGGYNRYNEAFLYLYGYFATGTEAGTYNFSTDLSLHPQYYDGTVGNIPVSRGSFSDVIIGSANPGTMTAKYGGVLEGYDGNSLDLDHAGFYSKTISKDTGVTGFVTGKTSDTSVNKITTLPTVAVDFLDTTVNQTNELRDYKVTLPEKWCGNTTDIVLSTISRGIVSDSGNENNNGPFTVVMDNGSTYTVSSLNSADAAITSAIAAGAHIKSISAQAKILAGNNIQVQLRNAVIEDGAYNNGDRVPIQLDVHSVTSNTDISVVGHLKYFDESAVSSSQFSVRNTLDYNISGTYTQGQTFTTGAKWTLLNKETTLSNSIDGRILIPGTAIAGATADVKLPTIIISSVDKGMIDLDQSRLGDWGWRYNGKKYSPVITDMGIDPTTGEHLTKLDFSQYTVTIPADTNPDRAFMFPDALPWKVSDIAAPATGVTSHWISQLIDNNKDALHPVYGGKTYDGSTGMKWTVTAPAHIAAKVGIAGSKTGENTFYTEKTGSAGFDRGLKSDDSDDNNSGRIMLSVTNGSPGDYTNAQEVAVLPSVENGDKFTLNLTGPVNEIQGSGARVLYSTKAYSLPKNGSYQSLDLTTSDWVDESKVNDWSTVRSVALVSDKLASQTVLAGYLPVAVADIKNTKIADTATVQSYSYAKGAIEGSDLSKNTPMKAQIYGIPQINVHYVETTDGTTSNGKVLADTETITGVDTNGTNPAYKAYQSQKKDIPGYTYKGLAQNSAPASGTLTDDTNDVTYLYAKDEQKVQIHYINVSGSDKTSDWKPEDGIELKDALQTLTGYSGETYTNTLAVPKGYDLVSADSGATSGSYDFDSNLTQDEYVYVKAQSQRVLYNVIDDTTKTNLESSVLFDSGDTDAPLSKTQEDLQKIAEAYESKGYKVDSVDKLPSKFDNDKNQDQIVNIYLSHLTTPATPEQPGTPGSPIDPNRPDGPKWPEGTDKSSLSKSITRTINYVDKKTGKTLKQEVQTVTYTRTAVVDKVTGELLGYDTNGDGKVDTTDDSASWTTTSDVWDKVVSPDYSTQGYGSPSVSEVAKETVTPDTDSSEVNVYYEHETTSVTPEHPSTPGSPIDPNRPDGPKWPEGTDKSSLSKTITRTINYVDKKTGKVLKQEVQTVTYTRTAVVDKVTGELLGYDTNGDGKVDTTDDSASWTTTSDVWDKLVSPDYSAQGYGSPSVSEVDKVTVTPDSKSAEVNVYYEHETTSVTPEQPGTPGSPIDPNRPDGPKWPEGTDKSSLSKTITRTINYVDKKTGKVLKQEVQTVTYTRTAVVDKVTGELLGYDTNGDGKVDTTEDAASWTTTSDVWDKLVSPDYSTQGYGSPSVSEVDKVTVTPDTDSSEVNVYYEHETTSVTPEQPGTPGSPINPNRPDGPKWPEGTDKSSLSKTITRTINYVDKKTGKVLKQEVQTVTYTRTAVVDKVTGELLGYDTNGDGKVDTTDDSASWTTTSDVWDKLVSPDYSAQGYGSPSVSEVDKVTVTPDTDSSEVNVYYEHETTSVTPEQPGTPGSPINPNRPDGPKWPEGTDKSSLSKTITRTINYVDKKTGKVLKQEVQTVTYTRTAVVDKVTGELLGYDTNGDGKVDTTEDAASWTTTSDVWDKLVSPDYSTQGYGAPSVSEVAKETVTPDTDSSEVNVYYEHETTSVTPEQPGTPGSPINPNRPDGPKWPEGTDKSSLSKTITRTINYVDKKTGKVLKQEVQTVTYTRTAVVDKVTGELLGYDINGDGKVDTTEDAASWTTTSNVWDKLVSPDYSAQGYGSPSVGEVAKETVTPDSKSTEVNVYYEHETTSVTPEQPGTPGSPIDPNRPDGPKWPEGTDKSSLSKTITRTINYVDKKTGKVLKQEVQTVTYTRTAVVDKVTGELLGYDTNGDGKVDTTDDSASWTTTSDVWDKLVSPDYSAQGYGSPSVSEVDEVTVTPDTDSTEVNVYYEQKPKDESDNSNKDKPESDKSAGQKNVDNNTKSTKVEKKLPATGESLLASLVWGVLGLLAVATSILLAKKRKRKED
ncbi:mucin-binding protein [Lactococcus ileimucosae]|uniref:mucin-binding protein n=1 Tax=Lactococcus ileimucosae TaxID=2941329 RepID=UPI003512EB5B